MNGNPAEWRRLADLLAQPGPARFLDALPARLVADLDLVSGLASGAAPDGPCECRVLILDFTRPGVCSLGAVLDAAAPEQSDIRPRWTVLRWDRTRDVAVSSSGADLAPAAVRAAVLDAHAVVAVIDYREVVTDAQRARQIAGLAGPWLRLAADWIAPELLTLAVDAVESSNSVPDSRLGWTRRAVRDRLALPDGWPTEGVVELSTTRAVEAIDKQARRAAPPGFAAHERTAQGISAVLDRTVGPFERAPARMFALAAMHSARRAFSRSASSLGEITAARLSDATAPDTDPDDLVSEQSARRRQAWLVARGLADPLAAAGPALSRALDKLREGRAA